MADINHVTLVGRLVRDAELKYISSGQAVCKFSVAVNKRRKNGEQWVDEPNFFDITLWGRLGESINQYLTKGKQVALEGELRQDRWEQDGQQRSKVEIVASNVMLLGGSGSGSSSGSGFNSYQRRENDSSGAGSANGYVPTASASMPADFSDDIPF